MIAALAAQVDAGESQSLAPGAVAALADLSRAEARLIFGVAGHRVHYDGAEPIARLIKLMSDGQRAAADADAVMRTGDEVQVFQELLPVEGAAAFRGGTTLSTWSATSGTIKRSTCSRS